MAANEDRPQLIAQINSMLGTHSRQQIADELGITKGTVSGILNRESGKYPKKRPLSKTDPPPPVPLMRRREVHCKWPVNDLPQPGVGEYLFCSNHHLPKLPYCALHARMAYQPLPVRSKRYGTQ